MRFKLRQIKNAGKAGDRLRRDARMEFHHHLVGHEPPFTGRRHTTDAATTAKTAAAATTWGQQTGTAAIAVAIAMSKNQTVGKIPRAPAATAFAAAARQFGTMTAMRDTVPSVHANAVARAGGVPRNTRTAKMSAAHSEKGSCMPRAAGPTCAGERRRQRQDENCSQCASFATHHRASSSRQAAPRPRRKVRPIMPNSLDLDRVSWRRSRGFAAGPSLTASRRRSRRSSCPTAASSRCWRDRPSAAWSARPEPGTARP